MAITSCDITKHAVDPGINIKHAGLSEDNNSVAERSPGCFCVFEVGPRISASGGFRG